MIKALFYHIFLYILLFLLLSLWILYGDCPKEGLLILLCGICMGAAVLGSCLAFFKRQDAVLEEASGKIEAYISGNYEIRLDSDEEGKLAYLFHQVNSLAGVLNAHVEKEARQKEFLKHTIADISHQLKTPLAALNVYNGILQEETKELPLISQFTDLSEQELDRIEILVQSLLKMAKLESGTVVLHKNEENASALMEQVKKRFSYRTEREGKEIRLKGGPELTVFCDSVWFLEAVDNIVKNALDHTGKGGVISLAWKSAAAMTRLTIEDNGSGIQEEDMPHIFKRFYRSRYSKDVQGIGLGLPLSKTIIEAHGGTLEVDSEKGKGTVFSIHLPNPSKL